jgi:hypothetical protein
VSFVRGKKIIINQKEIHTYYSAAAAAAAALGTMQRYIIYQFTVTVVRCTIRTTPMVRMHAISSYSSAHLTDSRVHRDFINSLFTSNALVISTIYPLMTSAPHP